MLLANMRMGTKLGLGFALVSVLALALGSISLWQMHQMHTSAKVVTQQAMPSVMDLGSLNTLWSRLRRAEAGILNVQSVAEVDGYASQIAKTLQTIETHERSFESVERDAQELELMAAYQQLRKQFLDGHQKFLQLARDKDYNQFESDMLLGDVVTNFYMGTAEPVFMQLMDVMQQLNVLSRTHAELAEQNESKSYEFAQTWVLVGMALSACCAALLGWLITRAVTVPAEQAVRVAQSIATGDLSATIPTGGKDEMGRLLQELATMRDKLEGVVSHVRSNADGVSISSEQIAMGNTDLSSRTEEQASALQQTAASMEQMAATVRNNADSASQANQLAMNASQVAVRGGEVVSQVVQTMQGIDASSQKMVDIIGVIDSIAFQTNILALNAGVEAARAGDQGRGFTVVASEVRALAARSAEAAREIKKLIDDSMARVHQGNQLVTQAGATMSEVVAAISHVSDLVAEISAASKEQSQGVEQVSEAVAQMDQTTQQNAALVEESAAAAAGLQRQAKDLVQAVASFKLRLSATHTLPGASQAAPRQVVKPAAAIQPKAVQPSEAMAASHSSGKPSAKSTALLQHDHEEWETF